MGNQAQRAGVACPRSTRFVFHSSSLYTPYATAIYPAILSSERCQLCVWVRCRGVCAGGVGGRGEGLSAIWPPEPSSLHSPPHHEGTQDWLPPSPRPARERGRREMGRDRWAWIVPFTLSSLEPS